MPDSSTDHAAVDGAYERMRRVAKYLLARERPDHTLQPTALVHEAWMRLANYRSDHELSPRELELLTCQVMRRVLTDHARRRQRAKRGPHAQDRQADVEGITGDGPRMVVAIDEALDELHEVDPELAQLVELRFYGGLTATEIAAHEGLSVRTVHRRWQLARAWLLETMADDGHVHPDLGDPS